LVDTHDNTFLGFCGHGQFAGATGNNDTSGPDGVLIRECGHRPVPKPASVVNRDDPIIARVRGVKSYRVDAGVPADDRPILGCKEKDSRSRW